MPINADKPHLWKKDIAASVDRFNMWFMRFAPETYRTTRARTTEAVIEALRLLDDLRGLSKETVRQHPSVLATLRMSTSPPLARDRLIGLAGANKNLVLSLESGKIPPRLSEKELNDHLKNICRIILRLLDRDIFTWLGGNRKPEKAERIRASTIVADRLCGAVADPIIRNAQEQRQLTLIEKFLRRNGYRRKAPVKGAAIHEMERGTFTFRHNLQVGKNRKVNIPIDIIIQPRKLRRNRVPILIEAKSAGDFTNTNKRRKEEAVKIRQIRDTYGKDVQLILFLCGYFDGGYLGYEAAEGLDWVWEHRIDDLMKLGL
jgi:hypothetical protein